MDILYLKHLVNGQYKGNQRFGVDICYLENLENANLVLVNRAGRACGYLLVYLLILLVALCQPRRGEPCKEGVDRCSGKTYSG